jgi:CHAD domain-containing protein
MAPRNALMEGRMKRDELPLPWDSVHEVARRQLDQFVSLEPKVLKGDDPQAIHDIRVASRRLQQVLDLLFRPPHSQKMGKLRRTLRRARRALSDVRNCDVLLERTKQALARKRTSRREAWSTFRDYLKLRRERSNRKGARRLSRLNLAAFYIRLDETLRAPLPLHTAPSADPGGTPAREEDALLDLRVREALRETWASLDKGLAQATEIPNPAGLHAVRIAAKKVRYLIEVIDELGVPGSDQALSSLRLLQQHLGDWHDLEVLEEMMLEMVARSGILQDRLELAMDIERLALRNRRGKKSYEQKFFAMIADSTEWRKLTGWVENFLAGGDSPKI